MNSRVLLYVSLASLLLGAAITAMGTMDQGASLAAVSEVWADALWDANRSVNRAARLSAQREMEIGETYAARYNLIPMPSDLSRYTSAIAARLRPFVRRQDIVYRIRVLDDATQVNAFALPGGYIFVYRGLLEQLTSEAQLAAVIGHEMAHVDLYHAIDHHRGPAATFLYSKEQEAEADRLGQTLAVRAGYHPEGLIEALAVFQSLLEPASQPVSPATSPVAELERAAQQSLQNSFRSHPPSAERISRLRVLLREQDSQWRRHQYCVGVENLKQRRTCTELAIPAEQVPY